MKPLYKHIILSFIALLVISYFVFSLWMSYHTMATPVCQHLYFRILDADQRQYVSTSELTQLVNQQHLYPVGQPSTQIALQPLEDLIRQHSMVRQAQCYKAIDGSVIITLTQRQPLLRVLTPCETYFIDTDRKIMPVRPSVTTPVLIATGEVSRRMAQHELSDFALWLQHTPYWNQRILRAEIHSPKMVHLIQDQGQAEIILGDWQHYQTKLSKLRHWYEADTLIHQNTYPTVDLRFHNQVIGIKN